VASFADRLLAWYGENRRDLPWRNTTDPWAIWVSEVMLQQTRVEVVRQVYPAFLARFPTPQALARAGDDELLAAWKGLGYYQRARRLREGARSVVERHGGRVPDTASALGELEGVGSYTKGAIASIAFGLPELAIDGNVERVVARYLAIREPVKSGPAARQVREAVEGWIDRRRPGDFNQALMELGALVCLPSAPRCARCPVRTGCLALQQGLQDELPSLPERRAAVEVQSRAVLVPLSRGRVLGSRIPDGTINAGQIDLPGPGVLVPSPTADHLEQVLRSRYGVTFTVGEVVTTVQHAITHHRIRLLVHRARCEHGPGPNLMAARPDDQRMPWTTVARKAFQQAALFLAARS
jgi:A/G-specific adenine glycosylase